MYDKAKIRATKLEMRRVLLEEWDPIGVRDEPLAQDEYDSYLGDIYDLLSQDADELKIAQHLSQIETVRMGMKGRSVDQLVLVARSLKKIPI